MQIAEPSPMPKNPKTGESYTNAEVARMSAGEITEEEVEGIRTGKIADTTVGYVAALAAVFGGCWRVWAPRRPSAS